MTTAANTSGPDSGANHGATAATPAASTNDANSELGSPSMNRQSASSKLAFKPMEGMVISTGRDTGISSPATWFS